MKPPELTRGRLLAEGHARLREAGIPTARLDAGLLISHVLGGARADLLIDRDCPVDPLDRAAIEDLWNRRAAGTPVSRLTGRREFWSLTFAVSPSVLDPRPDSETVIEAALEAADRTRPVRILDLGTGSGCLLLALLSELPQASGVGVDVSEPAIAVARTNARTFDLQERAQFLVGNWHAALAARFDILLCNPPYIAREEIADLNREVREFDPILALDGGADGLECYRRVVPGLADRLSPNGVAVFECGATQREALALMFAKEGYAVTWRTDLAGHARCAVLRAEP